MHQDLAYYRTMQLAGLVKNAGDGGTEISEDSTMIALYPPKSFAAKVKPHAAEDQRDKLHVTVIYLGHTTPEESELAGKILEKVTARHAPVDLSVNGAGVFYNPEGAVRQLLINGPRLTNFREDLFNALDDAGLMPEQKYGYIPHMTLEYHKDGQMPERWELVGKGSYPAWDATEVCLVRGDNTEKTCTLMAEKTAFRRAALRAQRALERAAELPAEKFVDSDHVYRGFTKLREMGVPEGLLGPAIQGGVYTTHFAGAPLRVAANTIQRLNEGGMTGTPLEFALDAAVTGGLGYGGHRAYNALAGDDA